MKPAAATPIYLDFNATTPLDPEVIRIMSEMMKTSFGNPSSTHYYGTESKKRIEQARKEVANLLNCKSHEVIFTGGGTESNNLAIRGIAHQLKNKGRHIITSEIEHPAVSEVCIQLEEEGFDISRIPPSDHGIIDPSDLAGTIRPDTILITIMHANNETGMIQPIREIAAIASRHQIILHSDAAQTVGKIRVDVQDMGVDLLSIAAHKFYGPKGVGALFIREGTRVSPIMYGADHEQNLRPGTENTIQIAGMGMAAKKARALLESGIQTGKKSRDLLWSLLREGMETIKTNTHFDHALPNTLSVIFPGIDANTLLSELSEIAASPGAACHASDVMVSPTLRSMGLSNEEALSTIRFSTGHSTRTEEIKRAASAIIEKAGKLSNKTEKIAVLKNERVKLTRYTHGLGCACKISPGILEKVFHHLDFRDDPRILAGFHNSEDASVYQVDENTAIVQTVDFFTPVVDDPFQFGEIAAANAFSDIYAMGGSPSMALNIVGFPHQRLDTTVLEEIIRGAQAVSEEAGVRILGGHTIENTEPVFGMAVTGFARPETLIYNSGGHENDVLILTKPLGTGILSTALKRDLLTKNQSAELYHTMRKLNKYAIEIIRTFPVHACTDITGFGLLGHLHEVCHASKLDAIVELPGIRFIDGAIDLAAQGMISGGTLNNKTHYSKYVTWDDAVSEPLRNLLFDGQTSGGLLFSLPPSRADECLKTLINANIPAFPIGRLIPGSGEKIFVKN